MIMSESQTYGRELFGPRRGQKLTSLRKLSSIRWSCSEEKKRRMVNARSATLIPTTKPSNSSVPPMVNLINVLVVTCILVSGRKIDSKGGAVQRKPGRRGASIAFRVSGAEKNDSALLLSSLIKKKYMCTIALKRGLVRVRGTVNTC